MVELTEQDMANVGPRDLKEEGSPVWCWQTVSLLQNMWTSLDLSYDRYTEVWEKANEHRIWEKIPADTPYGSLEAMKDKLKVGDAAEARLKVIDLAVQAKPLRKHPGRPSKNGEGNHVGPHDFENGHAPTQSEYLAARLARDFPEIHERMQLGEFKSVAAAAKEAGIYPDRPKRIAASPDKGRLAKSLLQAYGADGCEELIEVLRQTIAEARNGAQQ